ncbi:MAG: serine hydrolase [Candidatus Pacebacteria bacterium]|nr:serine hydrolase [Candidatus Paceibacterota bacterium]
MFYLPIDKHIHKILRDNSEEFKFTNPILDCESYADNDTVVFYKPMAAKVEEVKKTYNLDDVSLYFRDLNDGPWTGFGENGTFYPASLLKVPIVMGLYKDAENNPEILQKEVLLTEQDIARDLNQNIVFPDVLKKDTKYTFSEIAESVIKNSDNAGVSLILKNIPSEYVANVFKAVGVPFQDLTTEVPVRVKEYAGFFRVLFNASYLDREMSERMLELLSKSEYKDGLVAGVPEGVVVAHKFGERTIGKIKQLHDCGIVYYPGKPYLICIMTRGTDYTKEQSAIADLSRFIYQEVDQNK